MVDEKTHALMAQHYYTAKETEHGFVGLVYHYDATGNKRIVVFQELTSHDGKEEAIDSAVQWCEDNDVDAEMDFQ